MPVSLLGPSLGVVSTASMYTMMMFIPNLVIIVSTVLILVKAKSVALRWQGVLTVVLTVAVYLVSYMPTAVYSIAETYVPEAEPPGFFHVQFYRAADFLLYLNVMSNFYIYCLTVRSFRDFLKQRVMFIIAPTQTFRTSRSSRQEVKSQLRSTAISSTA